MNRYKRKFFLKEEFEDIINDILKFEQDYIDDSLQKLFIGKFYDMNVYTVNGEYVKKEHAIDFVNGGNDLAYDFIPEGELWLDNNLQVENFKYIIFQEYIEKTLMKNKGLLYEEAHEIANKYELQFRNKYKETFI